MFVVNFFPVEMLMFYAYNTCTYIWNKHVHSKRFPYDYNMWNFWWMNIIEIKENKQPQVSYNMYSVACKDKSKRDNCLMELSGKNEKKSNLWKMWKKSNLRKMWKKLNLLGFCAHWRRLFFAPKSFLRVAQILWTLPCI